MKGRRFEEWEVESFISMQYVGLKDKNGKEIYEGDIIKSKCLGDHYCICEIKWVDKEAAFGCYYEDGLFDYLDEHENNCQLIGNIYENKELIQ